MKFIKVNLAMPSDNSKTKTFYLLPNLNELDEQGIPVFNEKKVVNLTEFKNFIKTNQATSVDIAYQIYEADEAFSKQATLSSENFEEIINHGNTIKITENSYLIEVTNSNKKKNKMPIFIGIGAILFIIIIVAISSLLGKGNSEIIDEPQPEWTAETEATVETFPPDETEITTTELTVTEPETVEELPITEVETLQDITDITTENPLIEEDLESEFSDFEDVPPQETEPYIPPPPPTFSVSFDPNGGTLYNDTLNFSEVQGETVSLPTSGVYRSGYEFLGWSTFPDDSKNIVKRYKIADEDIAFYAVWRGIERTVRFSPNGGYGSISDIKVRVGEKVILPYKGVVNAKYKLSGWSKSPNGSALDELIMPNNDLSLYAVWGENPMSVTVTLIGNADNKQAITQNVNIGDTLKLQEDFGFEKYGYVISGWYLPEKSQNLLWEVKPKTDITLIAKWKTAKFITVKIDQSYAKTKAITMQIPLDIHGKAKLTLPKLDDVNDVFNHKNGYTYVFTDKNGKYFYGEQEAEFTTDCTIYRTLVKFAGGKGTKATPYLINSYDQLELLAKEGAKGYFKQICDIEFPENFKHQSIYTADITGRKSNVNADWFVYDGNGYSIKNMQSDGGLFGTISGATIKNITLENALIHAEKSTFEEGFENIGLIANRTKSYNFAKKLTADNVQYLAVTDSIIQNCNVINSKIELVKNVPKSASIYGNSPYPGYWGDVINGDAMLYTPEEIANYYSQKNPANVGGITGYGGKISNCLVENLEVSTKNCIKYEVQNLGGISGKPNTVTGSIVNNLKITGEKKSIDYTIIDVGGIVGNASGTVIYYGGENLKGRNSGGNIIGCGVRNLSVENTFSVGGIAGSGGTNAISSDISSGYVTELVYKNVYSKGLIFGREITGKNPHNISYLVIPKGSGTNAIGGKIRISELGEKIVYAPDYAFSIDGILAVLNHTNSGFSNWKRQNGINDGFAVNSKINIKTRNIEEFNYGNY